MTSEPCITDIEGVYANGIHCGIKTQEKKDLALIYVPKATASAGVFTSNRFAAPSVIHTKKALKSNILKAILINSGNANVGIGKFGMENTKKALKRTAKCLGIGINEIGMGSTGIIGQPLPIEKVLRGIEVITANPEQKLGREAAKAILTTDTTVKTFGKTVEINGNTITIAGMTKGSGMIEPNMATTLGYIVTDADIPSKELNQYLKSAIDHSYNLISVDTDTSTSDMVVALSTGKQKIKLIDLEQRHLFIDALTEVCQTLAKQIVMDGEGATKLIEVTVAGATSFTEAKTIAKSIVNSPLVKTAIYGQDPNWGRVLMAAGKVKSKLNPEKCAVSFAGQTVFSNGASCQYDEALMRQGLKQNEVEIKVSLNLSHHKVTVWGCDLTEGYVRINTDYN